jgi:hypothetical protein
MASKQKTTFTVEGSGGYVWELDELSPSVEDQIAKGLCVVSGSPQKDDGEGNGEDDGEG